jgi:hypothetical protein
MTEAAGGCSGYSSGPQTCAALIAAEGVDYCTLFDGHKPPKYRRGHNRDGGHPELDLRYDAVRVE